MKQIESEKLSESEADIPMRSIIVFENNFQGKKSHQTDRVQQKNMDPELQEINLKGGSFHNSFTTICNVGPGDQDSSHQKEFKIIVN